MDINTHKMDDLKPEFTALSTLQLKLNFFSCKIPLKLIIEPATPIRGYETKMAVCVAIIGKDNSPKYFCCQNPDEELSFQYKVLSSLDIVEEKLNPTNKSAGDSRELYLGMLYSLETHKLYGYVTNTKIKFIIVVDSTNMTLRDNEIRSMFRKLHSEYADIVCNPFYIPGDAIESKSFDSNVKNIMTGTV